MIAETLVLARGERVLIDDVGIGRALDGFRGLHVYSSHELSRMLVRKLSGAGPHTLALVVGNSGRDAWDGIAACMPRTSTRRHGSAVNART